MYARALFEAASDRDRVELIQRQLGELRAAVDSIDELRSLLENPEIESHAKAGVLERVAEGADEEILNFLRLLAEKGRTGQLSQIAAEFDALVAEANRVLDVELTTATELSSSELDDIVARIEAASGRKVKATRRVDPELIGGIVLQAGSMRLDASVRGRLERLRHDLTSPRS